MKTVVFSETIAAFDIKDLTSTVAKRGSVFIGLMTPDCAIFLFFFFFILV